MRRSAGRTRAVAGVATHLHVHDEALADRIGEAGWLAAVIAAMAALARRTLERRIDVSPSGFGPSLRRWPVLIRPRGRVRISAIPCGRGTPVGAAARPCTCKIFARTRLSEPESCSCRPLRAPRPRRPGWPIHRQPCGGLGNRGEFRGPVELFSREESSTAVGHMTDEPIPVELDLVDPGAFVGGGRRASPVRRRSRLASSHGGRRRSSRRSQPFSFVAMWCSFSGAREDFVPRSEAAVFGRRLAGIAFYVNRERA